MSLHDHPLRARQLRRALVLAFLPILAACGDDGMTVTPMDGGAESATRALFALAADPMEFGAIPFPDNLYLDEAGHIALDTYPNEDAAASRDYPRSLRDSLGTLDGFGAVSPAFFYFDAALDPASLPATPAESVAASASVFLIDIDAASTTRLARIPADVRFIPERNLLAIRPAEGHPLMQGRRYAAVVTTGVLDTAGTAVGPAMEFMSLRDAAMAPSDALQAEAYEQYAPVLDTLEGEGLARADVVALSVFNVQTVGGDLADLRTQLQEVTPELAIDEVVSGGALDALLGSPESEVPGLDVPGGVMHGRIGYLVNGRILNAPWYLDDTVNVHGVFERDGEGNFIAKASAPIPFTLILPPSGVEGLSVDQVVLFQHGLTADRSKAFGIADALCGAGYAVLAIDAPWHGLRAPGMPDTRNRFTGEMEPDGFGDPDGTSVVLDFTGLLDNSGDLVGFHPFYLRDALRQSAADLLLAIRAVRGADWSGLGEADDSLTDFAFPDEPIVFMGYSLGGIFGQLAIAVEPEVGASVLGVTGGSFFELVVQSPSFNPAYMPNLAALLGFDLDAIDYEDFGPSFLPECALWQTLLDKGDPINYASRTRGTPMDIFLLMARDDETVPNTATEATARALGLTFLGGAPRYTDLPMGSTPLVGNVMVEGEAVTRGIYVHEEASHQLFLNRNAAHTVESPVAPPFPALASPVSFVNPIDVAQEQILAFLETWAGGAAEIRAVE